MGKAYRYGSNVDTDVIIPARYLNTIDAKELASHCMEDIDAEFVKTVQPGDIIVADNNFGCGSSREHAPIAIKASGIQCVIARSFARIFFRNAINTGLPILECVDAVENTDMGDILTVDLSSGKIYNKTKDMTFQAGAVSAVYAQHHRCGRSYRLHFQKRLILARKFIFRRQRCAISWRSIRARQVQRSCFLMQKDRSIPRQGARSRSFFPSPAG